MIPDQVRERDDGKGEKMRILTLLLMIGMIFSLSHVALAKQQSSKHKRTVTVTKIHTYKRKAIRLAQGNTSYHHTSRNNINGTPQLAQELNRIINSDGPDAHVAVYVKSMKYGDVLYTRNIDKPLTPASILKVLTAEAALIYLGSNYRFSTQLLTDAKSIKKGVLQGNLYIVLSGDPSLTYDDLINLLLALKSNQILAIAGNVYIDDTAYDQRFYGPGWKAKDKQYCFAAPIGASIINHNCLAYKVVPSKLARQVAQVVATKKYFHPKRTAITRNNRYTYPCSLRLTTLPKSGITFDRCIADGRYTSAFSYVVTDIPDYNRSLFKTLLFKLGVNIYGQLTFGSAPNNLSLINSHASEPLSVLIKHMLKKSDNVIAGALFKKLGQLYSHQPGSWENGSIAVSQILSKRAGVNTLGLRILDGSGLSPENLTTPAQMMQVLDFAYHHNQISNEFVSALPVAGVDGTLKNRMGNIARKIRAKTGTISGVVSLAGYAISAEKEELAFVIMINGSKGLHWRYKSLEDEIATALTRYSRSSEIKAASLVRHSRQVHRYKAKHVIPDNNVENYFGENY